MPNKHCCQGPKSHEKATQSRLQEATGLLRRRYAQHEIDRNSYNDLFKYFCSQGCANQWLNKNMACVEGRTVVPFTSHRKTSSYIYENKRVKSRYGEHYFNEISRV